MRKRGHIPPGAGRSTDRFQRDRGFALLITITLLAVIVLLLVGLAAFTRVETAVAGNTQRQAQARENALLALNVALRELQQHAGPDQRVTATAENFGPTSGTSHYTGVWRTDSNDSAGQPRLISWLVSGNESFDPEADPAALPPVNPASAMTTANSVALVGARSSGVANDVLARLQPIQATGIPGTSTGAVTTIGRYAWWVGDEGVKAPVAVADNSSAVAYEPFVDATGNDLRSRIRQQLALGAGAANSATGVPVFEPRDATNAALVANEKVLSPAQIALLRVNASTQVGLTSLQSNFHHWSPNNRAVLANTQAGGLRQDLSLDPSLLGGAFAAWADYASYMEAPQNAASGSSGAPPTILPEYGANPLRRRYRMTPHQIDGTTGGGSHQVAPVLTYFLLSFNVRTINGSSATTGLEVRGRWMLSLWNPYSSALVPEDLRVEVSGLPTSVQIVNENPARAGVVGSFQLSSTYGNPLRMKLAWDASLPSGSTVPLEDRQSWLPGRVYTWRSIEDTTHGSNPGEGFPMRFYTRSFTAPGETNQGVQRDVLTGTTIDGNDLCHLVVGGSGQLTVTLYAARPDGDVRLARFVSPTFESDFSTTPQTMSAGTYQFSYVFRLAESLDTPAAPGTWLTTEGRDLRRRTLPSESFVVESSGNNPAAYPNYVTISKPERLLDRPENGFSFDEDVPVFELPRGPLLSLGALQHFRLVGRRPFMIGNSWGVGESLNGVRLGEVFDRFFFSGLTPAVTPTTSTTGSFVLPNPLLSPVRTSTGIKPAVDDLRGAAEARSGKHLLQGGAFNINSTSASAWTAVLRGVRFPAPQSFTYLDADPDRSTAGDSTTAPLQSTDAQFLRFSQSAQETYKAGGSIPPTELFRRGVRSLTALQVAALAAKIREFVMAKHAASPGGGPFRSMEEFLSPNAIFAGGAGAAPRSLLEAAIEDTSINTDAAGNPLEFSSQFLTQADVLTALAPFLFPRSDTFTIRTYGEVVNPATNAVEGRAWCEATVQRLPEYFNATADAPEVAPAALTDPAGLNQLYGRRFKIVSFRWLTRSDI